MAITQPQRGFALLIAVIFMSVMLSFGLALGSLSYKQQVLASSAVDSQFAFYAADAGLECGLYADQTQNLYAYPQANPSTVPQAKCDNTTSIPGFATKNWTSTQWIVSNRFQLDSNTRCADVTVYKPNGVGTTYIFSQGYSVPCTTVATPQTGARIVTRGISVQYSSAAPASGGSTPTTHVIFLKVGSGTSWTVPADWNSSDNTIEVIGGGGGGSAQTGSYGNGGGGGGAYAKATNVTMPAGSVTYSVGTGGTHDVDGGDTYICNTATNCGSIYWANVVAGARGGSKGDYENGGAGGPVSGSVGSTIIHAGGNGGGGPFTWGGMGGGGAAGPSGDGKPGGVSNWQNSSGDQMGGGGGAANGGTSGQNASGSSGGSGGDSTGAGGAGGTASSVSGGQGIDGGGGGGGYGSGSTNGQGGNGGNGVGFTDSNGVMAGPGGGGGGSGDSSGNTIKHPGAGGFYGGGGGGVAADWDSVGASGGDGIIVITYTSTGGGGGGGGGSPGPYSRSGWTATASNNNGLAPLALDGVSDWTHAWSTGATQVPGQWFQVDMGVSQPFTQITIDAGASTGDYPNAYEVYASADGSSWGSLIASGSGSQLTTINVAQTTARYIKVVQTGTNGGNWWSIYELNVIHN